MFGALGATQTHMCGSVSVCMYFHQNLEVRGFDKPFPVQSQCIPILMCGRDLIAVAETGSGKTLAYTLPLVRHVLSVKRQYKEYLAKQKEEKLLRLAQKQEKQQQEVSTEQGDSNTQPSEGTATPDAKGRRGKQNKPEDEEDRDRYRKNEKGERMLIYGDFREGMIGLVRRNLITLCGTLFRLVSSQPFRSRA